jgi:ribosomal protein L11 methyltransferase
MKEWQPFKQMPQPFQMRVSGDAAMLETVEAAVEDEVLTITHLMGSVEEEQREMHEDKGTLVVRRVVELVMLVDGEQSDMVRDMVERAAEPFGGAEITLERLDQTDWVSKVQEDFPAFVMGPFYVHGSHVEGTAPSNTYPLLIDAAAAFGTGEHATTAGCLLALAKEKKKRKHTKSVLDMGCGTAILAIGAARLWKNARIIACDYDPVAVKVSQHNTRVNRIGRRSTLFVSDGYKSAQLRRRGQQTYPVIAANILAKPLMKMARGASAHMAKDGTLILSGLLRSQEAMVLSAHRAQGRYLKDRIRRGNWSVLILK